MILLAFIAGYVAGCAATGWVFYKRSGRTVDDLTNWDETRR